MSSYRIFLQCDVNVDRVDKVLFVEETGVCGISEKVKATASVVVLEKALFGAAFNARVEQTRLWLHGRSEL
jgi:hypothetical protein